MGLFSAFRALLMYGLAIIGLLTVLFVVFSYGWDGNPPEVSIQAADD